MYTTLIQTCSILITLKNSIIVHAVEFLNAGQTRKNREDLKTQMQILFFQQMLFVEVLQVS